MQGTPLVAIASRRRRPLDGVQIQVRAIEEPYLLTAHGDAFRRLCESAGRSCRWWAERLCLSDLARDLRWPSRVGRPPEWSWGLVWGSGLGNRVTVHDASDVRRVAVIGALGAGLRDDQFMAPHGIGVDSKSDVYVAEVTGSWISGYLGEPFPLSDVPSLRKWVRTNSR
jgi:hypothetical protein